MVEFNYKKYKGSRASAFVQYGLVLGAVSLALIAMNTYIKRGLQGKVKNLTDTYISADQAADVSGPKATGSSKSNTQADASIAHKKMLGGATSIESRETSSTTTSGDGDDSALTGRPYIPDFVSAEDVFIAPPEFGSGED